MIVNSEHLAEASRDEPADDPSGDDWEARDIAGQPLTVRETVEDGHRVVTVRDLTLAEKRRRVLGDNPRTIELRVADDGTR